LKKNGSITPKIVANSQSANQTSIRKSYYTETQFKLTTTILGCGENVSTKRQRCRAARQMGEEDCWHYKWERFLLACGWFCGFLRSIMTQEDDNVRFYALAELAAPFTARTPEQIETQTLCISYVALCHHVRVPSVAPPSPFNPDFSAP
jgi:hypothetical protein